MAISMAVARENSVAGSRNVMYMAWKVPTVAVSAAEAAMAHSFTPLMLMPAAWAALSRSRTAVSA